MSDDEWEQALVNAETIRKLRAALEEIASFLPSDEQRKHLLDSIPDNSIRNTKEYYWRILQIARDALARQGK